MKKRKPPEQGPPEFNNNPFTSLKKLKPALASPQAPAKAPARKAAREDEDDLFRRAMSGARPLCEEAEEASPTAAGQKPVGTPSGGEQDEQHLFLQAMRKMGSTLRPPEAETDLDETPRSSPSNRMKQLKRGALRIGAELDLHGCLRDDALVKLKQFLAAAQGRRQKAVLVITGKGNNSAEGPVLQGAVADWLREKGTGLVAEFGPAPRDKGGSGAFVVFLKNG